MGAFREALAAPVSTSSLLTITARYLTQGSE